MTKLEETISVPHRDLCLNLLALPPCLVWATTPFPSLGFLLAVTRWLPLKNMWFFEREPSENDKMGGSYFRPPLYSGGLKSACPRVLET